MSSLPFNVAASDFVESYLIAKGKALGAEAVAAEATSFNIYEEDVPGFTITSITGDQDFAGKFNAALQNLLGESFKADGVSSHKGYVQQSFRGTPKQVAEQIYSSDPVIAQEIGAKLSQDFEKKHQPA